MLNNITIPPIPDLPAHMWACLAAIAIVAVLLVWLSLAMAAAEGAVPRVTRSSLNNLMIEEQTNDSESQVVRLRKLARIRRAKRLIADRYATSGACAFVRIVCNVLDGVAFAAIAAALGASLWLTLLIGLIVAMIVAIVSILVRPRSVGAAQPVFKLMRLSRIVSIAVFMNPFAKIASQGDLQSQSQNHKKNAALSDDEELENIQLDQAKASIDRLVEANDFDPEVSEMMRNVLTLSDTLTREIMVPRTDMICVKNDETLENFLKLCSRSGFSRVPIIGESVDDLEGIAYLKDAVRATVFNPAASSRAVSTISRSPMLVPESKPVDDLFHEMQRIRQHVAVVVDEYGGIAGLVTIEDAIEQIVGELEDEHDRTQHADPQEVSEGVWQMPARTPIADLEDIFEVHIDEDDVDTVFGLLTKLLGSVPIVGSSAVTRGLKLTAVDSAGRRKKVSTIQVVRDIQGLKEEDSVGKSGVKGDSKGDSRGDSKSDGVKNDAKSDSKSDGENSGKDKAGANESSQANGDNSLPRFLS
ncbi:hemolysin family protein [Gardnerella vaginalis]|uniref:CBS domain protein n=1 Tax=Gardnerella vaginalis TaxID=2702 RepID=A0A133NMK0_GARVA|nr:hemolysin family protein [Gardnerella vaginalis]KXA17516.1 CBS domain protein [Gardnerella vaginalis]